MRLYALRVFTRTSPAYTNLSHGQFTVRTAGTWHIYKNFRMASAPNTAQGVDAPSAPAPKRQNPGFHPNGPKPKHIKRQKKVKPSANDGSSPGDVLLADIRALLAAQSLSDHAPVTAEEIMRQVQPLPEKGTEIEVEVLDISSTGEGLAKQKGSDHIYVIPFTVPGDTVKVKVWHHVVADGYTNADFLSVVKPSPLRDDSRIQCKYFAKCSGCQFQMLDYSEQLKLKKNIVVKAYRNFSHLSPELVPEILDTIGSPLQYNYRTKLTPHFDGDPKGKKAFTERPPIGFTPKSSRRVMDIEDCPIATDAVRKGLTDERTRMETEFSNYKRGATILLRENTVRVTKPTAGEESVASSLPKGVPADAVKTETPAYTDYKTCETDNNATSTEYIDDFIFTNPAGSFFQNNNSILSPFTDYIRQHILPPPSDTAKPIRNLIDAYSGSGLFTITQSALFPGGSIGIDIAEKSIAYARRNAVLNGLPESQCRFIAADAPELFKSVSIYDPDETVVVIDPPRKGCDNSFLTQLLRFGPRRVVYVSCNVHTQARDVGVLVRGSMEKEMAPATEGEPKVMKMVRYEIESIRGFDFFPQTGHVEGVAVLNRVDAV